MSLPLLVLVASFAISQTAQSPPVDSSTTRIILLSPIIPTIKVNLVTQPNQQVKPHPQEDQKIRWKRNTLQNSLDAHVQPVNPWKIIGLVLIFWIIISSTSFPALCCAIRESSNELEFPGDQDYKETPQFNGALQQDRVTDVRLVRVPPPQSQIVGNFQSRNSFQSQITIQMVGPRVPQNNSDPSSEAFRSNPPSIITPSSQAMAHSQFKGPNRSYSIGNPLKPREQISQQVGESVGTSRHVQDSKSDNLQTSNYSVQQVVIQAQFLQQEANGIGKAKPEEASESPLDLKQSWLSSLPKGPQVQVSSQLQESLPRILSLQTMDNVRSNMFETEHFKQILQESQSLQREAAGKFKSEHPTFKVQTLGDQPSQKQEVGTIEQDHAAKEQCN